MECRNEDGAKFGLTWETRVGAFRMVTQAGC